MQLTKFELFLHQYISKCFLAGAHRVWAGSICNASQNCKTQKPSCLPNIQTAADVSFEVEVAVCRHSTLHRAHTMKQKQSLVLIRTLTWHKGWALAPAAAAPLFRPTAKSIMFPSAVSRSRHAERDAAEGRSGQKVGRQAAWPAKQRVRPFFRSKQKTSAQNGCFPVSSFVLKKKKLC